MEKINLLEFKIKDNLFGIRTEYIKTIFDIEKVKPVLLMPDYVVGITSVGKNAYLLICIEHLLGLSKESCKNVIGKTAIVVNVYGKLYAFIVDEILKIQEIEKNGSEDIVNFYNDQGKVLEEITPDFLNLQIKVPSLRYEKEKYELNKENSIKNVSYRTFLIFELNGHYFALNTDYVRKVEYLDNLEKSITAEDTLVEGVFLVKNYPVKALNFKTLFNLETDHKEESLIILEKEKMDFGIKADSILDILSIPEKEINKSENENAILKDFFVYKNTIIPVFSDEYLEKLLEKYALIREKSEEKKIKVDEKDFLLVDILGETFAIPMEKISEVLEYEDIHISGYLSDSKYIKGLGAFREKSFFIFTLENLLNKNINASSEDKKVIVLEEKGAYTSILISEIKDIVSIPLDRISKLDTQDSIVGGIVLDKNEEIINVINLEWMLKHKDKKL